MKALNFCLVVAFLLSVSGVCAADVWSKGENRISNGGFETDTVGETPDKWEIAKGG